MDETGLLEESSLSLPPHKRSRPLLFSFHLCHRSLPYPLIMLLPLVNPTLVASFVSTLSSRQSTTALRQQPPSLDDGVYTSQGPFAHFDIQWGQTPSLLRGAFDAPALLRNKIWPTWQDIVDLACTGNNQEEEEEEDTFYDEDDYDNEWFDDGSDFLPSTGHSARLIRHVPGKLDSFQAELGPFTRQDLDDLSENNDEHWSLLMNDVDRYRPKLADWMQEQFGFLPRWRRDDAQISIAPTGGGIGPHVDGYDVFLIQTAGTREWRIQPNRLVSVQEEMERLIPDLSVRILEPKEEEGVDNFVSIHMQPGDVLYLPPRVPHWGISTSDDCVTLSVGCRAPSAQEMVARLAEGILSSVQESATHRYTEESLLTSPTSFPSLTPRVRADMKQMVMSAVQHALEDEASWDALVGKLVTEPKRIAEIPALNEQGNDYLDVWGSTPKRVLSRVRTQPKAFLLRTPGISFATSRTELVDGQHVDRLYANGEMFEVPNDTHASAIFERIEQGWPLTKNHLDDASAELEETLLDLIAEGVIQADC